MSVAFATKCWGGDWQKMLAGGFERKVASCSHPFDSKIIILNNADSPDTIKDSLEMLTEDVFYAQDLKHAIERDFSVKDPNVYALGELVAIWVAGADSEQYSDYLCYVQGDCLIDPAYDWVTPGIKILEEQPMVSVVSPSSDVNTWHGEHGLDHYMSDQAWLVRVAEFRDPEIYQYSLRMPQDPDYPDYGGNSFEHMVGQYLKATGKYRKIIEEAYCVHPAY